MVVLTTKSKIIKGRIFSAQIIEDDIFYLNYSPNELALGSDYKAGYDAYNLLRNEKPMKVIVENGEYTIIDTSAREYLQNNKLIAKAAAIVLPSIGQRIVYNFYVKFRKQDHPIKAFTNFPKAKSWLNSLNV